MTFGISLSKRQNPIGAVFSLAILGHKPHFARGRAGANANLLLLSLSLFLLPEEMLSATKSPPHKKVQTKLKVCSQVQKEGKCIMFYWVNNNNHTGLLGKVEMGILGPHHKMPSFISIKHALIIQNSMRRGKCAAMRSHNILYSTVQNYACHLVSCL